MPCHAIHAGKETRLDNPADSCAKLALSHSPRAIDMCVVCFPFSTNQMHRNVSLIFNWLLVYASLYEWALNTPHFRLESKSNFLISFYSLSCHFEILTGIFIVPCDAPEIQHGDAYCDLEFYEIFPSGTQPLMAYSSITFVMLSHCQPTWHCSYIYVLKKNMQTDPSHLVFEIQPENSLTTHVIHSDEVNREKSSTKNWLNRIQGEDRKAPNWGISSSMWFRFIFSVIHSIAMNFVLLGFNVRFTPL